jgi:hypothetical protein
MKMARWLVVVLLLAAIPSVMGAGATYGPTGGGVASYTPSISLPDTIACAVGRQLNLWHDQLSPVMPGLDGSAFLFTAAKGRDRYRSYRWTAATADTTFPLTVQAINANGLVQASKTTRLYAPSSTEGVKYAHVLFIGDSMLQSNTFLETATVDSLFKNATAGGGACVRLLGTRGTGVNLSEGRGGWALADYADSTFRDNPFYINGRLNFKAWSIAHGDSSAKWEAGATDKAGPIDYVVIQLCGNDLWGIGAANMTSAQQTILLGYYDTLIAGILNPTYGYPNARILIVTEPLPANRVDAYGDDYGATAIWPYYINNLAKLNAAVIARYDARAYSGRVDVVAAGVTVDRTYGYPSELMAVSSRSPWTEQTYTNFLHPSSCGSYQLGDAIYSHLRLMMKDETNLNSLSAGQSEGFAVWTNYGAMTQNADIIAPDGVTDAESWTTAAATMSFFYLEDSVGQRLLTADNVVSCFFKYIGATSHIRIGGAWNAGAASNSCSFDLGTSGGNTTATYAGGSTTDYGVSYYPNGWTRIYVHVVPDAGDIGHPMQFNLFLETGTAAGTHTVGLWGAQLDHGVTIANSYQKR